MSLRISGITRPEFEQRVAHALEVFSGNPVRKLSRIRKATTILCHGGTGPGQNEHNLDQFFADEPAGASRDTDNRCLVIQLKFYNFEVSSDIAVLEDVDTFVCATTAAYEQKLADIFRANFPDSDRVLAEVLESSLVEDLVEARVEDEGANQSEEWAALDALDHPDMAEWLLATFGAEHLMLETDFFSDVLWMNMRQISVESTEIYGARGTSKRTAKAAQPHRDLGDGDGDGNFIDDITREAVMAALEQIDARMSDSNRSAGPLGDKLATQLHTLIQQSIQAHQHTPM